MSYKYYLYIYNCNDLRIVQTTTKKESILKKLLPQEIKDYNADEVQRCSLSRSKRYIREIALCNDFQFFFTLTVDSKNADRFSLDECQEKMRKILKKIKRRNKDFKYIIITEKHKDGAFHFHGLSTDTGDLVVNSYGYLSSYEFSTELGFNSFSPIRDYTKCCNYITKYITKDCVKNSHNQVYIVSKGLNRATRTELKDFPIEPTYENDYCKIQDVRLDKLSMQQILSLQDILERSVFE